MSGIALFDQLAVGTENPDEVVEVSDGHILIRRSGESVIHPGLVIAPSVKAYGTEPALIIQDVGDSLAVDAGFQIGRNAVWEGAEYVRWDEGKESSQIYMAPAGKMQFRYAAAAAGAVTWTEGVTIDAANGRIGMGTDTPLAFCHIKAGSHGGAAFATNTVLGIETNNINGYISFLGGSPDSGAPTSFGLLFGYTGQTSRGLSLIHI